MSGFSATYSHEDGWRIIRRPTEVEALQNVLAGIRAKTFELTTLHQEVLAREIAYRRLQIMSDDGSMSIRERAQLEDTITLKIASDFHISTTMVCKILVECALYITSVELDNA